MDREFGYNWGNLWPTLISLVVAVVLLIWKPGELNAVYWGCICIVIIFFIIKQTFSLCKVLLTESEIHLFFLSPLRMNQKLRFDEIDSYSELTIQRKGKKSPIAGLLKPKDGKRIMLLNIGTKNFIELSSILSGLFPQEGTEGS